MKSRNVCCLDFMPAQTGTQRATSARASETSARAINEVEQKCTISDSQWYLRCFFAGVAGVAFLVFSVAYNISEHPEWGVSKDQDVWRMPTWADYNDAASPYRPAIRYAIDNHEKMLYNTASGFMRYLKAAAFSAEVLEMAAIMCSIMVIFIFEQKDAWS